MVLFGGELELNDIKRVVTKNQGEELEAGQLQAPFVIIPINHEDFRRLSDASFLQLLACCGVNVNTPGHVYPRVDSIVQKEHLKKTIKLMHKALQHLCPHDDIDKQAVANLNVLN